MTHIDKQPSPPHIEPELERRILRAFAPLNARALGLSLGIVAALAISALTELSIVVDKDHKFPLHLPRLRLHISSPSSRSKRIAGTSTMR